MAKPIVAIIMGSDTDLPVMTEAVKVFEEYKIAFIVKILSAHRSPGDTAEFAKSARSKGLKVIIAGAGMSSGGRIRSHEKQYLGDPLATVLFVGYQGEGTLGAHLQAGAATVRIDGAVRQVRCRIRSISGFSAHADESELLDWVGAFVAGRRPGDAGVPRRVFVVHGDPEAQDALAPKVAALGLAPYIPVWREAVDLDAD